MIKINEFYDGFEDSDYDNPASYGLTCDRCGNSIERNSEWTYNEDTDEIVCIDCQAKEWRKKNKKRK